MTTTAKKTKTSSAKSASTKCGCSSSASGSETIKKRKKQTANECTEAACECTLDDYDIASDVLSSHKSLISKYGTALCEIDCAELRDLVSSTMNETADDQLEVFEYMNDHGMYKTEPAPLQKVKEARQKFCNSCGTGCKPKAKAAKPRQ